MTNRFLKLYIFALFLLIGYQVYGAPPLSLRISNGTPAFSVDVADLSGTAGTDTVAIENTTTILELDVTKTNGNWQMEVALSDVTAWNTNFNLSVKRNGNGTGGITIAGGTSYLTLTETDQTFFTGTGDTTNIPIQYMIGPGLASQGAVVTTYTVEITFTLTDGL